VRLRSRAYGTLSGMAGGPPRVDFFLSYTGVDRAWAEWIAWQLEDAGYTTRLQAWDFRPGANFVLEMQRAAAEADRTIAVLTPAYLESLFAQPEWAAAFAQDPTGADRRFVPVRVHRCELPGMLKQIVYVDLMDLSEQRARQALLSGIAGGRAKPAAAPRYPGAPATAPAPAPGPPAFPGTGAPILRSPDPSRTFTGRRALLTRLGDLLSSDGVVALHGLGGVGKTQTAAQFASTHADRYDVVWWIRAEEEQTRLADFAELGAALALPEHAAPDPIAAVERVVAWLSDHDRWLLVFDNAPDPDAVARLIPAGRRGHVLVTSRHQGGWRSVGTPLAVHVWEREESVAFLRSRTADADDAAADGVAGDLGDLPLALEQAAAYVDAMGISLAGYRERLREHAPTLFATGAARDYSATVATTWELAFEEVEADAGARLVVHVCAVLAPDPIPSRLVDALLPDLMERDRAIQAIRRFSLVTSSADAISMHRLVQQVVCGRLSAEERSSAANAALRAMLAVFPADGENAVHWPACVELLPHALTVLARLEERASGQSLDLHARLKRFYHGRGEYLLALPLCQVLCAAMAEKFGAESVELAAELNLLAELHARIGDLAAAEDACRRTLEIGERTWGPDHRNVAITLTNLGNVLRVQGDYVGARDAQQRALEALERHYGPDHPELVGALVSLGATLHSLGEDEEAKRLHVRALEIAESNDEHDVLELSVALASVATDLALLGNTDGAIAKYGEAIDLLVEAVGDEHIALATPLANLAVVYAERKDWAAAREHDERALAIMQAVLPKGHPDIVRCLKDLVRVHVRAGELDLALRRQHELVDLLAARLAPDDQKLLNEQRRLEEIRALA